MQLALDFSAPAPAYPVSDPRHPAYDRLNDGPLSAHELACLQAHGYVLIEHDDTGACFEVDGRRISLGPDYWRAEIDVWYLAAKAVAREVR